MITELVPEALAFVVLSARMVTEFESGHHHRRLICAIDVDCSQGRVTTRHPIH